MEEEEASDDSENNMMEEVADEKLGSEGEVSTQERADRNEQVAKWHGTSTNVQAGATGTAKAPEAASPGALGIIVGTVAKTAQNIWNFVSNSPTQSRPLSRLEGVLFSFASYLYSSQINLHYASCMHAP